MHKTGTYIISVNIELIRKVKHNNIETYITQL